MWTFEIIVNMFTSSSAIAENLILPKDIISVQMRNGSVRTRILSKQWRYAYLVSSDVARFLTFRGEQLQWPPLAEIAGFKISQLFIESHLVLLI